MDHKLNGIKKINTHIPDTPTTPKARASPTFEELLQESDSLRWTAPLSGKDHHDHEQDFGHHNNIINKKSVLAKMREKAKKLKITMSKRRYEPEDTGTPPWGVSLHDEDDEDHFGPSMHKSEVAPNQHKEIPKQQRRMNPNPRAITVVSEKHVLPNTIKKDVNEGEQTEEDRQKLDNISNTARILTKSFSERLAPAYNIMSDATSIFASKIGLFAINTSSEPVPSKGITMNDEQQTTTTKTTTADNGVSGNVKNYLMQKLEPGENEKALSQVISEAISPKKIHNEMGVMEKVRGAFTALIYRDTSSQSSKPIRNDQNNISSAHDECK